MCILHLFIMRSFCNRLQTFCLSSANPMSKIGHPTKPLNSKIQESRFLGHFLNPKTSKIQGSPQLFEPEDSSSGLVPGIVLKILKSESCTSINLRPTKHCSQAFWSKCSEHKASGCNCHSCWSVHSLTGIILEQDALFVLNILNIWRAMDAALSQKNAPFSSESPFSQRHAQRKSSSS